MPEENQEKKGLPFPLRLGAHCRRPSTCCNRVNCWRLGPHVLGDYDSSITLPKFLERIPEAAPPTTVEFRCETGPASGFRWRRQPGPAA